MIILNYTNIVVNIQSDANSEFKGIQIQFSNTGNNWTTTRFLTYSAPDLINISLTRTARYFRIIYQNGLVAQSSFALTTIFHISGETTNFAGDTGGRELLTKGTTSIVDPISDFNELLTVSWTPFMELKSIYGKNRIRDIYTDGVSFNASTSSFDITANEGSTESI